MHEESARNTKACPFCSEDILATAIKCKHCGERLDGRAVPSRTSSAPAAWNPGGAAVLNLVIPGSGFLYMGRNREGIETLIGVPILYLVCWGVALLFPMYTASHATKGEGWLTLIFVIALFLLPAGVHLWQVVKPFRIAEQERGKN